jgi:hypothetical protein
MTYVKYSEKCVNDSSLECICIVSRYLWSSIPLSIVRRHSSHWQAGSSITVWLSHRTSTQTNIIDESSRWKRENWVIWNFILVGCILLRYVHVYLSDIHLRSQLRNNVNKFSVAIAGICLKDIRVIWKLSTFCVLCGFGMHSQILENKRT